MEGTKRLNLTIQCTAVYNSSIEVPETMSFEEAIEYAKEHLEEAPLGELTYTRGSDTIDEENCDFDDDDVSEGKSAGMEVISKGSEETLYAESLPGFVNTLVSTLREITGDTP